MLSAAAIGNPASGAGRKLARARLRLAQNFHTHDIRWDECLEADLVVLLGGDGTLQRTVTDLLNWVAAHPDKSPARLPPLAIVPFGTTNMSARTINRSRGRVAALAQLEVVLNLESASAITTRAQPMLAVTSTDTTRYGFCFALGAIVNAVQNWRARRGDASAVNQFRSLFALIRGFSSTAQNSTPIVVESENLAIYTLLATTLRELMYGCKPFWGTACDPRAWDSQAGDPPALLRCTWIESGTPGLLGLAPAILRGAPRLEGIPGFTSCALNQATLRFEGPFVLDGEIYGNDGSELLISTSDSLRWVSL